MRVAPLSPFVALVALVAIAPTCLAGWGGPTAPGGVAFAGNASVNASRGAPPAVVSNLGGGVRGMPSTSGWAGSRAPQNGAGPAGGGRFSPITANARPVGFAAAPAPLRSTSFPSASRPSTSPVVATSPRVYRPVATGVTTPASPLPSAGPTAALAAGSNHSRPRPGDGSPLQARPRGFRPTPSYYRNFGNNNGWLRAGHYVPGECYVQEPGVTAYGFGPSYYLGGAFPYFYGGSYGGTGIYFDPGVNANAFDPAGQAPATTALPPEIPTEPAPADAVAPAPSRRSTVPSPLAGPNSLVEAVQAELLRRGYFGGRPDGVFTSEAGEALRRFQENHGLARTGLINEATLFALGLN